jgi:hypothetical protein
MKISELIKELELVAEKHGDVDMRFSISDYYSTYGTEAILIKALGCMNKDMNWYTLRLSLRNDEDGKHPKITFRK